MASQKNEADQARHGEPVSGPARFRDISLLVAGRSPFGGDDEGPEPDSREPGGLHRWDCGGGRWTGTRLDTVDILKALAAHPSLPVVYGVSGTEKAGRIHAWDLADGGARKIGEIPSRGGATCHVAIDPSGQVLVVTNYATSTLGVLRLATDGGFGDGYELVELAGSGIDRDRQDAAHPHQALFAGGRLWVIDLGADLLREFAVEPAEDAARVLSPVGETPVPAGTGPRHGVILDDERFAISGELASTLIVGRPGSGAEDWAVCRSSQQTGDEQAQPVRNYPGDIQRSGDGAFVYLANRGFGTVSTFDVRRQIPALVSEVKSGFDWPQHLLVVDDGLLVADSNASRVTRLPLKEGVPGAAGFAFDCSGAGWLLRWPRVDVTSGNVNKRGTY